MINAVIGCSNQQAPGLTCGRTKRRLRGGTRLAAPDSLEYDGQIFVWHDRISSITSVVGLLDPEDPLDVDEGTMDDAMTSFIFLQQNVHAELHYATQVHNAPQTRSNLASQDASL